MINFNLLKAVVQQIKEDAKDGDYTAIEDLLKDIPKKRLTGFLTEDRKSLVNKKSTTNRSFNNEITSYKI
tara:strand:+ start:1005 stop:1214 length:210 start_codon:yes stop_codon:yes gene_type:complete